MVVVISIILLLIASTVLLIKKTRLKYHLALIWSRFPLLNDKYAGNLIEYGMEGLEKPRIPCRIRCNRIRCCPCFNRGSDDSESIYSGSTTTYDSGGSMVSMVRNHYEMEDGNYYEDISYSDQEREQYPMKIRDKRYSESSSCSSDDLSYDKKKSGTRR